MSTSSHCGFLRGLRTAAAPCGLTLVAEHSDERTLVINDGLLWASYELTGAYRGEQYVYHPMLKYDQLIKPLPKAAISDMPRNEAIALCKLRVAQLLYALRKYDEGIVVVHMALMLASTLETRCSVGYHTDLNLNDVDGRLQYCAYMDMVMEEAILYGGVN